MAYVITLVALLATFVWVAPVHTFVVDNVREATQSVQSITESGSAPLTASIRSAAGSVREKAMELLRRELHRSIDSLIQ